jgi:uncharacterized protein
VKYFLLFTLFCLTGCATYQNKVARAKSSLKSNNCEAALKDLNELSSPSGVDQLAYLMDYGTALQICKQYEKSNAIFSQAEKLADEIDFVSVSQVASATLLNEGYIAYKGDSFEKLFLNASKALNYLNMNDYDSALIEVRRMNQKFTKYKSENKKNHELNSFSKYLSGLIWQSTGQYDDACIDYKDAFQSTLNTASQSEIKQLSFQMLKSCWQARRIDEFQQLLKKVSLEKKEIDAIKDEKNKSELVLIYLKGWGPQKLENPSQPIFPYLVKSNSQTQSLRIEILNNQNNVIGTFQSQPIYSVAEAARLSLEADQAPLIARRIAARVAKQVTADQIRQKDPTLGLAALIVMVGSERADLRQWSFLPDAIHTIRVPLQPGKYGVKAIGLDAFQNPSESFDNFDFTINNNKQIIIKSIRSLL